MRIIEEQVNTGNKVSIKSRVDTALEQLLSNIYTENGIKYGDITPDQDELWGSLSTQVAKLFEELLKQNSR